MPEEQKMPRLVEILSEFYQVPPTFKVDSLTLRATWQWALDTGVGKPEPTFSADDLPVLHFVATLDEGDDDSGPVYQTPGGLVLYT